MNRNRLDNERMIRIVSLDFNGGNAFALLDDSANDTELADAIRHEAGHIPGTLDHGRARLKRNNNSL